MATNGGAQERLPPTVMVKNTFIDVQENMDLNNYGVNFDRRQVSAPCPSFCRMFSGGPSPLLQEEPITEGIKEDSDQEQQAEQQAEQRASGPGFELLSAFCGDDKAIAEPLPARRSHFLHAAPLEDVGAQSSAPSAELVAGASAISPASLPPDWQNAHTVMMRNLPNKYTQQMLLNEVNQAGFYGTFDFLYLPIDPETGANRGYAFMNFTHPCYAWMFKTMYEGRKMSSFNSSKVVGVTPAALQGFQANYDHYSTARVNRGDPSTRPLFLREPSSPTMVAAARRGRRRRGGGASAIDVAARQQQSQRHEFDRQRQQQEHQMPGVAQPEAWQDAGGSTPPTSMTGGVQPEGWQDPQVNMSPTSALVAIMSAACRDSTLSDERVPSKEAAASRPRTANFCPHCGEKVQSHFHFCQGCGASTALDLRLHPSAPAGGTQADDTFGQKVGEDLPMGASSAQMYYVMMPPCYPDPSAAAASWLAA